MKQHLTKILASAILLMFVNFMFSNTIFMHVHKDIDGRLVTHSHPYNPGSGHTHSGNSINLISVFNLAAVAALGSSAPIIYKYENYLYVLTFGSDASISSYHFSASGLRSPPIKK